MDFIKALLKFGKKKWKQKNRILPEEFILLRKAKPGSDFLYL